MDHSDPLGREGQDWGVMAAAFMVLAAVAAIILWMVADGYGHAWLGLMVLLGRLTLVAIQLAGLVVAAVAIIVAVVAALLGRWTLAVTALLVAVVAFCGWLVANMVLDLIAGINPGPPPGHWDV